MILGDFLKKCVLAVYLWWYASAVNAQNLTIPSDVWRNSTSSISRESREYLAHAAAVPFSDIDITVGDSGGLYIQSVTSFYAVLALQDYRSGNLTWRDMATNNLRALIQQRNGFWGDDQKKYSDVIYWGLGIFYAYRTYKEQFLLDYVLDAWNITYTGAFINTTVAASGVGLGRNVSFALPANCTSGTYAGGVFFVEDQPDNLYVNMFTVGPMMILSAYLFEETQDAIYQQVAQLSLNFIINHLWNGTILLDGIQLNSCYTRDYFLSGNQAWFIEGLAVWANVTQNQTLTTLLNMAIPSITTFPMWTTPDGVVNDQNQDFDESVKGLYIRGLAEARMRNPGSELARYIEAYVNVQFNAVLDLSREAAPNDNYYSRSWIGPPATSFNAYGNIGALEVLNAAFSLVEPSIPSGADNTSTSGGPSPTSTSRPAPAKSSNTGTIAGAAVGGVVALVAAIATVFACHRRMRAGTVDTDNGHYEPSGTGSIEPFISRIAYNPPFPSKEERTNVAQQANALTPSLSASPGSVSTPDTIRDQGLEHETTGIAALPGLIQRLVNLLQGRQDEQPPQYGE